MKTYIKPYFKILVVILCLSSLSDLFSQVTFAPRGAANYSIKGDFTLIGNTNLTLQNYSNTENNSNQTMIFVDEDDNIVPALPASTGTSNSSSANLVFSGENGAIPACSNVLFAGLYWTGRTDGTPTDLEKRTIKFRHDDQNTYQTIVANVGDIEHPGSNAMYASYADVTDIVVANGIGKYWAADVAITTGNGGSTGYYGGWALVVVYENDQMKWRDVTIFDGYGYLAGNANSNETLNVTGFNAVQSGPVNVKMGMIAGEGDVGIPGDYFEIRNAANTTWVPLSHSGNTAANFFNSSIETGGNARTPNLTNNTGLDISMFNINNTGNLIIDNGDTSTRFRFGTTQDTYIIFNIAISIDAFVPSTTGALAVNSINGDMTVTQPYTMNPGEVVNYSLDVTNNGSESLNNVQLTIPLPNTGIFSPGSITSQVNAPATTTSLPFYDMTAGPYGSIIWNIGNLPLSDPDDILLTLDFDLTASTNCETFNTPSCTPFISLDASSLTGFGDLSGEPFTIKFIQGFQDSGDCMGEPIREPIVIQIIPVLVIENEASPLTVECDGNGNITEIENWLNSGGNASIVGDCDITWTDDYTTITSNSCGAGGSTTVTFVGTDSCGNTATTSALLTIEDTTPPNISTCGVTSPTLDCGSSAEATADAWHAANIAALQACPTDLCNGNNVYNITSNYNFGNLDSSASCGSTGTLTVIYFATDDCNNTGNISATLTIVDNADPTWTVAPSDSISVQCDPTTNATAFTDWLNSFSGDDACGSATVSNNSTGLSDDCGATGSETVTFTLTDLCGNAISQDATFTIIDNSNPTWTVAPSDSISVECDPTTNAAAFADWLDSFSGEDTCGTAEVTHNSSGLSDDCGGTGTETVTFTLTDLCGNSISQDATFTIVDNTNPTWTVAPSDSTTVQCDGTSDPNGAFADWLDSFSGIDSCGSATVTHDSEIGLSDGCGATGTETVTFTLTDLCGNAISQDATFTIIDTIGPDLSNCTAVADEAVECTANDNETIADAWDAANILALETCGTDACNTGTTFTVNSDYNYNNLSTVCGPCGNITINYTVADECGNISNISATLSFGDNFGPDLSSCDITNDTIECNGTDNETIADAWNQANLDELAICADDINVIITHNYLFTNLVSTCGAGGTITVTYIATDDCDNESSLTATLTLNDSIGPDLTNCSVSDDIIECNGTGNETLADAWNAANILALQTCGTDSCDANATFEVDSDYLFTNLVSTCGAGGTITVTYTVTDDCDNPTDIIVTLTLNDSIGPDLTNCSVSDDIIECNGTDNETLADAWNAANILALQTCGTDSCDVDATFNVDSDYLFTNLISTCGAGGTITVTYTVTDDCNNPTQLIATLTLNDSIGPDLTNCSVSDDIIECNGTDNETLADAWNAANILALQTCGTDSCDADATFNVDSDYLFTNLISTCGAGGTITVTYSVTDDCNNPTQLIATLTLNDSIGPDLTNCSVSDDIIECDGANNETIANDWNAANILALQTCGSDSCDADATFDVDSDYLFTNLVTTCGAGGTITVTYTVTDDCNNPTQLIATLTLNDSIGPDLTNCSVANETIECDGANNETIANDWNAANILALQSCGTDSCDTDATFDVDSNYLFTNLVTTCGAGGTITITYTVTDDCNNPTQLIATLTLNDSIGPDLTNCSVTNLAVECTATDNETIADAWHAANILALQTCGTDSCDTNATFDVSSNYDFDNLNTVCGPCGNITVIYAVGDDCGNETTVSATLSFGDNFGPDLSSCDITDETIECNGTDNETIADAWHQANIDELVICADDINVTITHDYEFINLISTCGAGGTITVTYTATDDCDNESSLTATLTLEDSIGPDLSACTVVNETIECNGTDNETIADAWNAANILALQTCGTDSCDTDATFDVADDYDFGNLVSTCGAGGTITVTYTVTDDCNNPTSLIATLTLNDSIGPDLANCSVIDETIECNGTDNETIADAWNSANVLALQTCGTDSCDTDATFNVGSDYLFTNLVSTCGAGGTITVTYTVTDDCNNPTQLIATLTLNDSIGPDLTNCAVADEAVECTATDNETIADAWNLANIAELESCPIDACDSDAVFTVNSDYDFNNLNTVCGPCGNITVNYTVADDCGNISTISATLSFGDNFGPDLSSCDITDETIECNGTDNETIADAWNAANIAELVICADDINVTITHDYLFTNLVTTCGAGGTITVTYTATDDCDNESSLVATLTLEDSIGPDLTNCTVTNETIECNGTDNETIANDWNAANILALQTCGTDSCDADATFDVDSDYVFTNLTSTCGAGGTITVTYTVTDDCDNPTELIATLTLNDSTGPDLTNCSVTNETIECNGTDNETIADDWNAANVLALQTCGTDSCDTDATFDVADDYDFGNLISTCGAGGTITVTYTITDDCNNPTSLIATLTLNDSIGPDLTNCTVVDETIECNGTDNETIANEWNAANILALQTCGTDSCDTDATFNVDSDYLFTNLVSTCGAGGTITVTYTVTDDCNNPTNLIATLTLNDSIGPDLSNCNVANEAVECTATDNETIADAWNLANIAELETCPVDACDTDAVFTVTSDYDFNNLNTVCGPCGNIIVNYTVADDCGNVSTISATLSFGDNFGPDLSSCDVTDETIECNGTDNEAIADAWNAANIAELVICADDINVTITHDYLFTNLVTTCGAGGTITVTYTATDDCDNSSTLVATLTLEDSIGPDLTSCTVVDETIECNGTDNESIADAWNAANILALQTCGTDSCDTDATFDVISDYAFTNLDSTCGAGGTITVIYTVSDDCGNSTDLTATLTLEDSIGPDLSSCSVVDETIECNGSDNETIANDWNAANILALQSCGTDSCDTDATFDATSDYDFANLVTTCGAGGTITVIYTVSDDCGNDTNLTATLTLEDSIGPDLSNCNVTNEEVECTADDNETIADAWNAANIAELETCGTDSCDTDAVFTVTSDYDFNNLNTVCGPCGNLIVNYTVADDCGNTSTISATLSFGDSTGPDLSNCDVTDETIECNGTDNETIADEWNATNIAELEACADDISVTITSDYEFTNLSSTCGAGGTITVTYTATDDCDNSSTLIATLTLEDSTGPDLSACTVVDETIECNGALNETIADEWNAANILALETCGTDSCDTDAIFSVSSDYAFANLETTCGAGGTITVIYTVSDDCDNSSTLTATLTLNDSTPPDLSVCTEVTDETLECNGTDNEAIADAWNQGNIDDLMVCPADDCDVDATYTVTSDYDFANLDTSSACGAGGSLPVTYTIADDCGNESTITVTLTLSDTTPPDLTVCSEVTDETIECNGDDNEAIADAWNQGNIDDLMVCPADDCDVDATYTVTSDYDFANLDTSSACGAGGSLPVTYTVADDCGNEATITVTLTLEDTTPPDLTVCSEVTDETIECNGDDNEAIADAWNQGNIDDLMVCPSDDCDVDATYTVTSDYDFANLDTSSACGAGGSLPVTYTVADDCGNEATLTVTLTLSDTTPPDLTVCSEVTDETIECNGDDNEAIADAWNQGNIDDLMVCPSDDCDVDATYTVTSDYAFTNLVTTCGLGGTITVTYTVADDCDNSATIMAILTLEDTTPPDLSSCNVISETVECEGDDNESIADQWNADNIAALEACAADSCDTDFTGQVTSDYSYSNLETTCGLAGSITIEYTITDDCGNPSTISVTLTIEDNTAPDLSGCNVTDEVLECDGENNEAIADQWNADNIAALEACVADSCDADFSGQVTSDYDFSNLTSAPGLGGMLDVEYTITDDCGNVITLYAMMTLQNTSVSANDIALCNASPEEAVVLDLFDLLDGYYDDGGTWEVIDGNATIDGSLFDPLSVEIGFYSFSYTENDSSCPTYIEVTVEVHDRCFVLNCSLDNVIISKAVTPNGDQYNEFFEVGGVELCGYITDVKLFNRWGALIYESHDYQNDWNGAAHQNSIGGANTVPNGTYYYIVTLKDSGIDPINGYIYVGTK